MSRQHCCPELPEVLQFFTNDIIFIFWVGLLKVLIAKFGGSSSSIEDLPFDPVLLQRYRIGCVVESLLLDQSSPEVSIEFFKTILSSLSSLESASMSLSKAVLELKRTLTVLSAPNAGQLLSTFDSLWAGESQERLSELRTDFSKIKTNAQLEDLKKSTLSEETFSSLKNSILTSLKDIYMMMEPPLISRMAATSLLGAAEEGGKIDGLTEKSFEFHTQAQQQAIDEDEEMPYQQPLDPVGIDNTQQCHPTVVLPESSQESTTQPSKGAPKPQGMSFSLMKALSKFCDRGVEDLFNEPDPIIDARISELKKRNDQSSESPKEDNIALGELLPKEAEDQGGGKPKKRLTFEDEPIETEVCPKKKSLLLPNETSKKIEWDSLGPPSSPLPAAPCTKENIQVSQNDLNSSQPKVTPGKVGTITTSSQAFEPVIANRPAPPLSAQSVSSVMKTGKPPQKGRRPFSQQEVEFLKDGYRRYGKKWSVILASYQFADRTAVDLKDKARNLAKKGEIKL